jgi:hypothetical protein
MSPRKYASTLRFTTSTFSRDIAYSDSPAASRAPSRLANPWTRTTLPSRMSLSDDQTASNRLRAFGPATA